MEKNIHAYVDVDVYVYMCTYVCVIVCVFTYIHIFYICTWLCPLGDLLPICWSDMSRIARHDLWRKRGLMPLLGMTLVIANISWNITLVRMVRYRQLKLHLWSSLLNWIIPQRHKTISDRECDDGGDCNRHPSLLYSNINSELSGKIICTWRIFHCHILWYLIEMNPCNLQSGILR